MKRHLVLMVKEPRPGRVKTRLGRDIGTIEATWWFRHQVAATLRYLRDPRWTLWLAVAPDTALRSRVWPGNLPRVAQGQGDLGDRMGQLLRSMPPGPVCIVGADIPGLRARHVARAFAALGTAEAVFGPATDGGYWLVGLRRTGAVPAGMFGGVRWSTEHALADSVASLNGRSVALADMLRDVDTADDLAPQAVQGAAKRPC